jgi:Tat protein secretion system quality control protein TatD with DNase activity
MNMNQTGPRCPVYVDAHAHLDEYPDTWLGAVLDQLEEDRIATISVAMAPGSYERPPDQERSPWVLATLGVHPWNAPYYVTRSTNWRLARWQPMFANWDWTTELP